MYSALGGLRQAPGREAESTAVARIYGHVSLDMRVLLSTYGSRGDVQPLAALAVQSVGEINQQALFGRVAAVAGTIRTDGATVAAKLLLDTVSRESTADDRGKGVWR
jgi:hypothetical protein